MSLFTVKTVHPYNGSEGFRIVEFKEFVMITPKRARTPERFLMFADGSVEPLGGTRILETREAAEMYMDYQKQIYELDLRKTTLRKLGEAISYTGKPTGYYRSNIPNSYAEDYDRIKANTEEVLIWVSGEK